MKPMKPIDELIPPAWKSILEEETRSAYFADLNAFLSEEFASAEVYPRPNDLFRALQLTDFEKVKVVVIGQDPYHGPGQADGLCFSVREGVRVPPSLRNILEEIHRDLGVHPKVSGDLTPWANQGVLLLNTVLTVRAGSAGSHRSKGWEKFTDALLRKLSENRSHLVFLLWGNPAMRKSGLIDRDKHLILTSAHPSPLSVYRGFRGNGHFGKTNEYLRAKGIDPIIW